MKNSFYYIVILALILLAAYVIFLGRGGFGWIIVAVIILAITAPENKDK